MLVHGLAVAKLADDEIFGRTTAKSVRGEAKSPDRRFATVFADLLLLYAIYLHHSALSRTEHSRVFASLLVLHIGSCWCFILLLCRAI